MKQRSERIFDGLRYAPGARFRIVKDGARLSGMKPSGPSSFDGWAQVLHVGDLLTCDGFGRGWGGDPGYGVEFSSDHSRAEGAVHCEMKPNVGGLWNYRPDPSYVEALDPAE